MNRCKNCTCFKLLKCDFTVGVGFTYKHCCTLYANDENGFVLEVTENDSCECFQNKGR